MFYDISESIAKQTIDSEQTWAALIQAESRAFNYRGSMFWKKTGDREYLCRQYGMRQSKSLGLRSVDTENILEEFKTGRRVATEHLNSLKSAMDRHYRVNVALRVGRVPNTVVDLLNELRRAGLQDHFLVIGTNALFAYETHAGVRFESDITATVDCDLLWDSRKRITLLSDSGDDFKKSGLMGIVKKVDKSFVLQSDMGYRAVNSSGYMIDVIKRRPASLFDDKEHSRLSHHEDDFWAAKIINRDWLLSAPKFRQFVTSVNGKVAQMTTIDPRAYVLHKLCLSQKQDRDPIKKPRDIAQARALFSLIQDRMPHLDFAKLSSMPARLRDEGAMNLLNQSNGLDATFLSPIIRG